MPFLRWSVADSRVVFHLFRLVLSGWQMASTRSSPPAASIPPSSVDGSGGASSLPAAWRGELLALLWYQLDHRLASVPLPPWVSHLPARDPSACAFHELVGAISSCVRQHQTRAQALLVTQHQWAIEKEEARLESLKIMSAWMETEAVRREHAERVADQERQLAREAAIERERARFELVPHQRVHQARAVRWGETMVKEVEPLADYSLASHTTDDDDDPSFNESDLSLAEEEEEEPDEEESSDSLDLDSSTDEEGDARANKRRLKALPPMITPATHAASTGAPAAGAGRPISTAGFTPAKLPPRSSLTHEEKKVQAMLARARALEAASDGPLTEAAAGAAAASSALPVSTPVPNQKPRLTAAQAKRLAEYTAEQQHATEAARAAAHANAIADDTAGGALSQPSFASSLNGADISSSSVEAAAAAASSPSSTAVAPSSILLPPSDVQAVIDRTASYVRRVGLEFEREILSRQRGPQFDFVADPTHLYHAYYRWKVQHGTDEEEEDQPAQHQHQQQPPPQQHQHQTTENDAPRSAPTSSAFPAVKSTALGLADLDEAEKSSPPPGVAPTLRAPQSTPTPTMLVSLSAQLPQSVHVGHPSSEPPASSSAGRTTRKTKLVRKTRLVPAAAHTVGTSPPTTVAGPRLTVSTSSPATSSSLVSPRPVLLSPARQKKNSLILAAQQQREDDLRQVCEQEAHTKEEEAKRQELLEKILRQQGKKTAAAAAAASSSAAAAAAAATVPRIVRLEQDLVAELRLKTKQMRRAPPSAELNGLLYQQLDAEDEQWLPPDTSDEDAGAGRDSDFESDDGAAKLAGPPKSAAVVAAPPVAMVEVSEYEEVSTDDDEPAAGAPAAAANPPPTSSSMGGLQVAKPISLADK